MEQRIILQWTTTAKDQLARLSPKVRKGLLAKANLLRESDDPKAPHKALTGPLQGYYRITYSRYRAIYSVREECLPDDTTLVYVKVLFVAVGIRKERDKKDVYDVAKRLIQFGLDEVVDEEDLGIQDSPPPSE